MAARKTTKKKSAKKAPARSSKAGTRRSSSKTSAAKKATAKKAAVKKATAKKAAVKKATSKKAPAKKATAKKKAAPKKAPARKRSGGKVDRVAEIQRVIDVMVEAGAVEVELEEAGSKLRVRLKEDPPVSVVGYAPSAAPVAAPAAGAAPAAAAPEAAGGAAPAAAPVDDGSRSVFKSPMVGTFYRAASPDAEPYADVGKEINPDSTICILEAMKVMNEIKAETSGRIVEILVQNGEPVEFGQPLFVIEGL